MKINTVSIMETSTQRYGSCNELNRIRSIKYRLGYVTSREIYKQSVSVGSNNNSARVG